MNTPYEELEYLADYLPDEGEAVLVTRREGELVCESYQRESTVPGLSDPEFYGRLVQANERLNTVGARPLWASVLFLFWACVAVHQVGGLGWEGWPYDAGLALMTPAGCFAWIKARQARVFRDEIYPIIRWQFRRRGLDRYTLIGAIRHHPELRTLLDELVRWDD